MGTNKNSDYREELTKHISHEINCKEFISRVKDGCERVFSRQRKLDIRKLIVFIMSFKSALQRDLDRFYKAMSNSDFNIREVTKSALSQSRSKLNPWAFVRLNEISVDFFYKKASYYTWHGMRTLAVDGTRLQLPNHPTVKEEFGEYMFGPKASTPRSMAMGSMLYDVLNHITLDAEIAPYASSERDLLVQHLKKVEKGDLLLLDRGYPCFWLFFLLKAKGVEFCIRLENEWWKEVESLMASPEQERIVKFRLPKKDHGKLSEYPEIISQEIDCRLIKVKLETGETEILCTSLTDLKKYDIEEFKRLYHYRWNEEECYKLLKSRLDLESFSGKTAKAVRQDFHAKVFLLTLCAAYCHPIEAKVLAEYEEEQKEQEQKEEEQKEEKGKKKRKYQQKPNKTNALANLMDMLIPIFLKRKYRKAVKAFDDIVSRTKEVVRPDRKVDRPKKIKKPHSMNYKKL
ncbi:IS4 family transposase [Cytophagaceae bacterium ABcell3]|nr:IS4 family transposase [Cytophagaceae bacterium ABcell3]